MGEIKFHTGDILNRLKELENMEKEYKTWWSIFRLQEAGIKFADGGSKVTRRAETRIDTQTTLGLASKQTLQDVLRRGWPECYIPDC